MIWWLVLNGISYIIHRLSIIVILVHPRICTIKVVARLLLILHLLGIMLHILLLK